MRHRRLLETAQFGKLPFEPSCVCFALAGGGFRDSPGVEELRRILIEFPDPGFGDLKAFGGNFGVEFLLEELLAQSCRLAADCGLSLEELEEMLRLVYEGD